VLLLNEIGGEGDKILFLYMYKACYEGEIDEWGKNPKHYVTLLKKI